MPNQYNISQIMLLQQQRMLNQKLKKGDFIFVGKESLSQVEDILKKHQILYIVLEHSFNVMMVTVN